MVIGTKYHSNSAYLLKFLVQFEAQYLPQIAPETVSEHEYVLGGMPPDPPRGACLDFYQNLSDSGSATVQPSQTKMSRSAPTSNDMVLYSIL